MSKSSKSSKNLSAGQKSISRLTGEEGYAKLVKKGHKNEIQRNINTKIILYYFKNDQVDAIKTFDEEFTLAEKAEMLESIGIIAPSLTQAYKIFKEKEKHE